MSTTIPRTFVFLRAASGPVIHIEGERGETICDSVGASRGNRRWYLALRETEATCKRCLRKLATVVAEDHTVAIDMHAEFVLTAELKAKGQLVVKADSFTLTARTLRGMSQRGLVESVAYRDGTIGYWLPATAEDAAAEFAEWTAETNEFAELPAVELTEDELIRREAELAQETAEAHQDAEDEFMFGPAEPVAEVPAPAKPARPARGAATRFEDEHGNKHCPRCAMLALGMSESFAWDATVSEVSKLRVLMAERAERPDLSIYPVAIREITEAGTKGRTVRCANCEEDYEL